MEYTSADNLLVQGVYDQRARSGVDVQNLIGVVQFHLTPPRAVLLPLDVHHHTWELEYFHLLWVWSKLAKVCRGEWPKSGSEESITYRIELINQTYLLLVLFPTVGHLWNVDGNAVLTLLNTSIGVMNWSTSLMTSVFLESTTRCNRVFYVELAQIPPSMKMGHSYPFCILYHVSTTPTQFIQENILVRGTNPEGFGE